MTKAEIDAVLERVRTWPEDRQADLAAIAVRIEEQGLTSYELSPEDELALDEAEAEIARGEVASEEEVRAVLERLRRVG